MRGKFITFEGSEGSGKSTQIELVQTYLESQEKNILFLRDPGGVPISERVRDLLLDIKSKDMGDECETLLYMAARAQLVKEIVMPELEAGKIILCDRFLDSTIAYQGYGNGVNVEMIQTIGAFATRGIQPDLTFLFDLDTTEGLARINREKDRIEQRNLDYHDRVRRGYLELARQEPGRIKVIDAAQTKEAIQKAVRNHIDQLLGLKTNG